jgi:hypothetical protein
MFRLIKKFSLWFIIYPGLLLGFGLPTFNYDRLTGPDPMGLSFATYLAPMIWLVLAAMWSHEQMESKSNGYAFLSILPIEPAQIVKAKFAIVFVSVAIYVGGCCAAFALISTSPEYLIPSSGYVITYGNICLLVAALLYIGIFRYGYSRFGKYVLVAWVCLLITPIPIRILILKPRGISGSEIMQFFKEPYWIIGAFVCLAGYYFLMKLAIRKLSNNYA